MRINHVDRFFHRDGENVHGRLHLSKVVHQFLSTITVMVFSGEF